MKVFVTEKPIAHNKWTIEIHTDRYGTKFVTARRETIYGSVLEVRVEKHDGFNIPYEKHHHLMDNEELLKVRDEMVKVLNSVQPTERRYCR